MNSYLETGIAVALVYFVFSIVAYIIQEIIAIKLKYRGKMLQLSIEQLLGASNVNEKLAEKLFQHPQIKLLQKKIGTLPSYVPSSNFAMAVLDIIASKGSNPTGDLLLDFKAGIAKFANATDDLPTLFKTWADNSQTSKELKENIEKWFNEYMDRVSGWYKSQATNVTRLIAIGIVLFFNVDIIRITQIIHGDSVLKATMVATAERMVDKPDVVQAYYKDNLTNQMNVIDSIFVKDTAGQPQLAIARFTAKRDSSKNALLSSYEKQQVNVAKSLIDSLDAKKLVFGWVDGNPLKTIDASGNKRNRTIGECLFLLLGLGLGAAGISMGAPFWFDMMSKLVNVRRAGLKPGGDTVKK
jgi:thioredoxin-related protein